MRLGIVPHAGQDTAGDVRQRVFDHLKRASATVKRIFYVAAVHMAGSAQQTWKDNVWVVQLPESGTRTALATLPPRYRTSGEDNPHQIEHSYRWVSPELSAAFPSAVHIVLYAGYLYDPRELARWIQQEYRPADDVVLCTTDLTHYGQKEYGWSIGAEMINSLWYRNWKEQALIQALLAVDVDAVRRIATDWSLMVTDAPIALQVAALIGREQQLHGRVVDYYDSSAVAPPTATNNLLDRYTVNWLQGPDVMFVSYVGIVYYGTTTPSSNDVDDYDALQALGALRSIVLASVQLNIGVLQTDWSNLLPSWSVWRQRRQGVFVGTNVASSAQLQQDLGTTNCSIGEFQQALTGPGSTTTADKILSSAASCPNDAATRWQRPYANYIAKPNRTVDNAQLWQMDSAMSYKIELLDDASLWLHADSVDELERILASMFAKQQQSQQQRQRNAAQFLLQHGAGVRLTLPDGQSATFLPIVGRQWFELQGLDEEKAAVRNISPENMWLDYLTSLTQKAGGDGHEWHLPGTVFQLYGTRAWTWDNRNHSLRLLQTSLPVARAETTTRTVTGPSTALFATLVI